MGPNTCRSAVDQGVVGVAVPPTAKKKKCPASFFKHSRRPAGTEQRSVCQAQGISEARHHRQARFPGTKHVKCTVVRLGVVLTYAC